MRAVGKGFAVLMAVMGLAGSVAAMDVLPRAAENPSVQTQDPYWQRISQAMADFEAGRHDQRLYGEFQTIIGDRRFKDLNTASRLGLLALGGRLAMDLGEGARGREWLLRSRDIEPTAYADYLLAFQSLLDKQGDDAAFYLAQALRADAQMLDEFNEQMVPQALRQVEYGSQPRLNLLQTLFDVGWNQRGQGASGTWYSLIEARIQRGQANLAQAPLQRVDAPMTLIKLRSDQRFDGLLSANTMLPTPEAAAAARVALLKEQVLAHPRSLERVQGLARALMVLGQWEQVISMSGDSLARAHNRAADDEPPFDDMDQLAILQEIRANALLSVGRVDEAVTEMEQAATLTHRGEANVSQVLDLGLMYCSLDRPDDALKVIAKVGEMSAYGSLVQHTVQLRAALLKQDEAAARRAFDYLRKHRTDGQEMYLDALIYTNRLDEAAKEMIRQLDNLETRGDTLLQLQQLREPPTLPGQVAYEQRWQALKARADVQAAIARVGRVQQYALYPNWSE